MWRVADVTVDKVAATRDPLIWGIKIVTQNAAAVLDYNQIQNAATPAKQPLEGLEARRAGRTARGGVRR
jgi:hypothetical protein